MILLYQADGSRIHGRGLFACTAGRKGERVRTPCPCDGFNRSCTPNAQPIPGERDVYRIETSTRVINVDAAVFELLCDVAMGEEITLGYDLVDGPCLCPICSPA